MPDFVIFKDNFEPRFLEVKFRHNSLVTSKQINHYSNYPNVIFLIYDKDNIYSYYPDYETKGYIKSDIVFKDDPVFEFNDIEKNIIEGFIKVTKSLYINLPTNIDDRIDSSANPALPAKSQKR
jgi:hypothetical protein